MTQIRWSIPGKKRNFQRTFLSASSKADKNNSKDHGHQPEQSPSRCRKNPVYHSRSLIFCAPSLPAHICQSAIQTGWKSGCPFRPPYRPQYAQRSLISVPQTPSGLSLFYHIWLLLLKKSVSAPTVRSAVPESGCPDLRQSGHKRPFPAHLPEKSSRFGSFPRLPYCYMKLPGLPSQPAVLCSPVRIFPLTFPYILKTVPVHTIPDAFRYESRSFEFSGMYTRHFQLHSR